MKVKLKFYAFWLLPILTAFFFEWAVADFGSYRTWNLLENIFFTAGMLLSLTFFRQERIKKIVANCYFLVLVGSLFFESVFFYLFGANLSASAVFILLQTNADEAMEFLQFYTDTNIILFFLSLVLATIFYFRMPKKSLFTHRSKKVKWQMLFVFLSLLTMMKFTGLIDPNLPYLVGRSAVQYVREQHKIEAMNLSAPTGHFSAVKNAKEQEEALYVLVIGESTVRNHLGIYGYSRATTPRLNDIKNELLIYQKAISKHAYTIGALKAALVWQDSAAKSASSLVQLMNQAGFKTFWISNQRPLGPYESQVTSIAKAAEVVRFSNMEIDGKHTPFDAVLLPYLDQALADTAAQKFIVLHVLGTHVKYQHRYPPQWTYFTKKPPLGKFENPKAISTINAYDNAVRYMDNFLREVIEKVREKKQSSYVLFFSDHGEEVYDVRPFAGHVEANPTQNMFEIPYVLWRSKEFIKTQDIFTQHLNTAFVTENLIFSISDLSQIYFEGIDYSKSIFSTTYSTGRRIVGKGIDFDKRFLQRKAVR